MKSRLQKYKCSNIYNEYSNQIYPIYIKRVEYIEDISIKYPNGIITVSCDTTDGYWVSGFLKARKSSKGYYAVFGGYRIYEGFCGAVELIGVPMVAQGCISEMVKDVGGNIRKY